jgi:peptide/nickel transport system permease protein
MLPLLLFGVTILIFALLSLLTPYDRVALYVRDIPRRPGAIDELVVRYGLNDPIPVQYWRWMVGRKDAETGEVEGGVLRGDLGWSHVGRSSVAGAIAHRLPATAELALWAAVPLIGASIWMGVQAATHHNKLVDQMLRVLATAGWSIPTFLFGLLVLMIFYARLGWFPPERLSAWAMRAVQSDAFMRYTEMNTLDAVLNLRFDVLLDALRHLILPVVTLSVLNWAFLLRVTRTSMLDTLREDYMTTARAKGLQEQQVIRRHAVPNALIPVITVGGLTLINLFNGVVITETVFGYPGMGSFLAEAALALDVVSVLGVTLFSSFVLIFGNLVVDVLYAVVDPRIRLA